MAHRLIDSFTEKGIQNYINRSRMVHLFDNGMNRREMKGMCRLAAGRFDLQGGASQGNGKALTVPCRSSGVIADGFLPVGLADKPRMILSKC